MISRSVCFSMLFLSNIETSQKNFSKPVSHVIDRISNNLKFIVFSSMNT